MVTVEKALELVRKSIIPTNQKESKSVLKALNQTLFEDVFSPINMPPFRQSAMDGYAVHLHDNLVYKVIDEVKAGDGHNPDLKPGEATRIFTGAAVPDSANAVVIQEKVLVNGNEIRVENQIKLNDNIRPLGEQVKLGDMALKKGTKLTPAAIGFLSSLGITDVSVYKKPSIALIVTGNELMEAGKPLSYGKVYESNSGLLRSALLDLGFSNVSVHRVEDSYDKTLGLLDKAVEENDLIIISGGISVGDYDFVGKALGELKVEEVFYKVKQKPGKPLFFGKKEDKIIFALPGNPASALTCFYIYVNCALQIMNGNTMHLSTKNKAKLTSSYNKKGERAEFLKAYYENGQVTILEGQSSAMLQTYALANSLVYLPLESVEINKNDEVTVITLPILKG